MNDKILLRIFALLFLFSLTSAAETEYVNENREIFRLASSIASGRSDIAFSHDGSPVSNPANLIYSDRKNVQCGYSAYYDNSFGSTVICAVLPVDQKLSAALSLSYLYIPVEFTDDFIVDSVTSDVIIKNFSNHVLSEMYSNFSLGYRLLENTKYTLSIGGALHLQRRDLLVYKGYGIGADIAATLKLTKPEVRFSLLVNDATTTYQRWSTHYSVSAKPQIRFGAGVTREIDYLFGYIQFMYKSPDFLSGTGSYNLMSQNKKEDVVPEDNTVLSDPFMLVTAGSYGVNLTMYTIVHIYAGLDEYKRKSFGSSLDLFERKLTLDFGYSTEDLLPSSYSLSCGFQW